MLLLILFIIFVAFVNNSEMMLGDNWNCGHITYPANATKAIEIMKYCTGAENETK